MNYYNLIKPLLFKIDPESAHNSMLKLANASNHLGLLKNIYPHDSLKVNLFNLEFPNPIGISAGFDKNGEYTDILTSLGFGFIEVGTVTPKPQNGNPRPRLFRLEKNQAIINRMGFNNKGVDNLILNLQKRKNKTIIGINIGANKDTKPEKRIEDYLICLNKVFTEAYYIVINISSPNTPGLRDLQKIEELRPLLQNLKSEWLKLREIHKKSPALLLKLAPDLDDPDIIKISELLLETKFDGVIATNTTVSRTNLNSELHINETGGLSGKPLKTRALEVVKILNNNLQNQIPIVGCGGIMNGEDAFEFQVAGAKLVQIYSGLIYNGPKLISECIKKLK